MHCLSPLIRSLVQMGANSHSVNSPPLQQRKQAHSRISTLVWRVSGITLPGSFQFPGLFIHGQWQSVFPYSFLKLFHTHVWHLLCKNYHNRKGKILDLMGWELLFLKISHFDSEKTQDKDKLSFGLGSFLVAVLFPPTHNSSFSKWDPHIACHSINWKENKYV